MTTWQSRMVILGEQLFDDDLYVASVWTSTDGAIWRLDGTPPAFDGAGYSRFWKDSVGLVVGIYWDESGSLVEQLWTSADLADWRAIGSPRPCGLQSISTRIAGCIPY